MARRSEHSQEEIKEMVLKAAEVIVVEEGFSELKVRKVAMEIGYTVGSIYMVFDNMADLIMHVKGRTLDDIAEQLKAVINDANAEQTIVQLAKTYLSFASQNFNRWSMIFEHQLAEDAVVPDWYQQKVDNIFSLVEQQFKKLPASHTDEESQLAARALWSGVHGVCTLSLTGKLDLVGVNNVENTVVLLVDNFIKGWESS
ncbi:MAG: TetR/AcrR family transcriptional regulator [Methylococcales bacterium]|nr:TetR/AcrR family transcriptional regulator [Methylococcales bacterium]